ncbi:MAG: preprotein translocase subunit SecE [Oscillospiraceae bacterium]
MADKKKSPKASSKPNSSKPAVATTSKDEKVETEIVVDKTADKAEKSKKTKEVAATSDAKSKSSKSDKSSKDKSEKDKGGKKAGKAASFKQFFKDLKSETKKISWNSKEDTIKSTGVVLLVVCLIGVGIWIVDFGFTSLREFMYELSQSNAEEARIMLSMMLSDLM